MGSEKKKVGRAQKICPNCEAAINVGLSQCNFCEYVFLKEEVEKELKHEAKADLLSDMNSAHSVEKCYEVGMINYSEHASAAGNKSLRVEYLSGNKNFSEYVPFGNEQPWAKKKCLDFIRPRSNLLPESVEEALELCKDWRKPEIIRVAPQKKNPKYWEVVGIEQWR